MLPTVAFKERRSFRPLSGLEEMQAHQQTGTGKKIIKYY